MLPILILLMNSLKYVTCSFNNIQGRQFKVTPTIITLQMSICKRLLSLARRPLKPGLHSPHSSHKGQIPTGFLLSLPPLLTPLLIPLELLGTTILLPTISVTLGVRTCVKKELQTSSAPTQTSTMLAHKRSSRQTMGELGPSQP
jgi:hypothetical protein